LPPTLEDRLNDIQTAIERIESLFAAVSREEFEKDWIRRLAAERLLEILSEASRHIPLAVKDSVDVPWRDIADFGNLPIPTCCGISAATI
jgi:uncharacterized protein with HEPN domain